MNPDEFTCIEDAFAYGKCSEQCEICKQFNTQEDDKK